MERARCQKNLTMRELAERSGIGLRTVKDYAALGSRRRRGWRYTIEKLNRALDVDLHQLARKITAEREAEAKRARRRRAKVQ